MPHPCPVCGIPVEQRSDVGRPRVYCTPAHRAEASRRRKVEAATRRALEERAAQEADLDAREADLLAAAALAVVASARVTK